MSTALMESPTEILDLRETPNALAALTRAEIDTQITTAKRFPRSPDRFLKSACSMVAFSTDLAQQCTFALPRDGKTIKGPSVRLAEIVAACWGNLRIAGRLVADDGKMVTAQGVAMDLEANVGYSLEVKRRVTTKASKRFGDDMVITASNAAIAIVTRNVTFKAVPRAFVNIVWDEAQAVAAGDVKTLPDRIAKALDWFAGRGVAGHEVFRALGVGGPADITNDLMQTLTGFKVALNEGHATADEIFRPAPPEPAKPPRRGVEGLAEAMGTKTERVPGEEG